MVVNTSRLLASRNVSGHLGVRQIQSRRRQIPSAFDQGLQLGFALTRSSHARAQLVLRRLQFVLHDGTRRAELGRDAVFDDCLVQFEQSGQPPRLLEMRLERASLRSLQAFSRPLAVWFQPDGLCVFDNRAVVVLGELGVLSSMQSGRGRTPGGRHREQEAPGGDGGFSATNR